MEKVENYLTIVRLRKDYNLLRFKNDLLAGITLATIAVPQAMAYALLANLPPNTGLYTTIFSNACQLFLGGTPFQSLGPFAVVSLMTGNAILSCAYSLQDAGFPALVAADSLKPWEQYPIILPIVEFLTFFVAIALLIIMVFDLGKHLDILCPPSIIAGFTSAAAFAVFTSQLKGVLGLKIPNSTGTFIIYKTYYSIISNLAETKWISVIIATTTILIILLIENTEPFILHQFYLGYQWIVKKLTGNEPVPKKINSVLPHILTAIIVVTLISYITRLDQSIGLSIVGNIQTGVPEFHVPWRIFNIVPSNFYGTLLSSLLPDAFSIILIVYVSLKSTLQTFPFPKPVPASDSVELDTGVSHLAQEESVSRSVESESTPESAVLNGISTSNFQEMVVANELISLGLAGLLCSIGSGFVSSPSLSRSAVLATKTDATSTVSNGVTALIIVFVVLLLTDAVYFIPIACLSAIVIIAIVSTLQKSSEGYKLLKIAIVTKEEDSIFTASLWIITYVGVIAFDPTIGIVMGIFLFLIIEAYKFVNLRRTANEIAES